MTICYKTVAFYVWFSVVVAAIPFERRADTIHIQQQRGYVPYTKTISVKIDQTQDFICPVQVDLELYLVSSSERTSMHTCDITRLQLLHKCVSQEASKFTLYYSSMTPTGWLEFQRGSKYWILTSDCSVQITIYVW